VRERRNNNARAWFGGRRLLGAVASIILWLLAKAARRPVDSLAIVGAVVASLVIVVNALYLQSRAHPAPFVANPTSLPHAVESRLAAPVMAAPKSEEIVPARQAVGMRTAPQPVAGHRNDPIAELISSSMPAPSRVIAVQRVLSEFGYGQIRPSGIIDEPTRAAIEKFESDHKLPVTGRLSDRLLSELGAMTGRRIE
jgi:Putative peptidoglycan binding domain